MFQIQLTGHEMNGSVSHQQSEQYATENGHNTEFKTHGDMESCRLDMDPRMSKRSIKFGGHSESK